MAPRESGSGRPTPREAPILISALSVSAFQLFGVRHQGANGQLERSLFWRRRRFARWRQLGIRRNGRKIAFDRDRFFLPGVPVNRRQCVGALLAQGIALVDVVFRHHFELAGARGYHQARGCSRRIRLRVCDEFREIRLHPDPSDDRENRQQNQEAAAADAQPCKNAKTFFRGRGGSIHARRLMKTGASTQALPAKREARCFVIEPRPRVR